MRRRTRAPSAALAVLAAALALAVAGCARKGAPTGGPPDLEPPRVVSFAPDSGTAGVARTTTLSMTFSESMEPRSTGDAVDLLPPVTIRQRRWSGRTLTLVLGDTLRADQAYRLVVTNAARDRHGNSLRDGRAIVFTTAATFPPGSIEGRIAAVGFGVPGTSLWCYRDGRSPDSTARDFDAIGVADAEGRFRIGGLPAPGRFRLWAFADLNGNRSFEPEKDLLVAADTLFELSEASPVAAGFEMRMVNPRAPARVLGTVLDTLGVREGAVRVYALSETDTTKRVLYEIAPSGGFDLQYEPGTYVLRAWRDLDRNRIWKRETEPASDSVRVVLGPGSVVENVRFVLRRPAAPGAPADTSGSEP
jgi:hypothetical protein